MKHVYAFLLVAFASLAQAQTFDWLTTLSSSETTKAQTNIQYVAYYADSTALVLGNYGSLHATDAGVLGDNQYAGAEYGTGSGYNKNLLLTKLDKQGKVLWAIHSEDGDINDSQSAVTATADGGAVLALKFRHSEHNKQKGVTAPLYKIVDAAGQTYSHDLEYPGVWVNQPVLVRVDKEGRITAVIDLWCSSEKAAQGKDLTPDAFTFAAAVEDEQGNIFICGSQSLDMKIGDVTLAARPQPEWKGTTTDARYNGFVLKLDADLNYVAHIATEGAVLNDKPFCAAIRGSKLYLSGLAKAEEIANLSIGSKSAEVKELSTINACLTTDLEAEWLTATPIVHFNDKQNNLLYQSLLSADGSTLYLTGGMMGEVAFGNQTIHSGGEQIGTMNDGYLFAFSTADGALTNAAVIGNTTMNLNRGVVEYGDSLYVYNYMYGTIQQVAYSRELVRGSQTLLATGGGSSTLVYTTALNGQVLLALRSKGGADFSVMGRVQNIPGLWFNTILAFHLDGTQPSGVEQSVVRGQQAVGKVLRDGQIVIIRDNKTYSILGQQQ